MYSILYVSLASLVKLDDGTDCFKVCIPSLEAPPGQRLYPSVLVNTAFGIVPDTQRLNRSF